MDETLRNFQVLSNKDSEIFWNKLTTENGWSLAYSEHIFSEYLKFIWLAKISDRRIIPSKNIDKVWHLHMTFTQSYWNDLCKDILDFEFHHIPSSQNDKSQDKDRIDYTRTLEIYEKEFGYLAPSNFWPYKEENKPGFMTCGLLTFFYMTCLTACSQLTNGNLTLVLKWALVIFIIVKVLQWLSSNGGGGSHGGGGGCGSSCGGGD